jgi:sugar phosphate isomerase/epimerase
VRLAGHTYAFRSAPLAEALEQLAAIGFSDVEVWLGHCPDGPAAAASILEERGVQACAVSAGGLYREGDDTARRAFELAQALGAPTVVLCVSPDLVGLLAAQKPDGITVAVENHWDQPLDTSARVLAAIHDAPTLAACLDTGHALTAGEPPDAAARTLGKRLAHVHLKDARRRTRLEILLGRRARKRLLRKPEPAFPGEGALDIAQLRETLAAQGFDGWVTCEHEGGEPAAALAALREAWTSTRSAR